MVDDALDIFNNMTEKFRIVPNIMHYNCVVDVLGRLTFVSFVCECVL